MNSTVTSRKLCGRSLSHPPPSCDPSSPPVTHISLVSILNLGHLGWLQVFLSQNHLFWPLVFFPRIHGHLNELTRQDILRKFFTAPISQWFFSIWEATPSKRKLEDFTVGRTVVAKPNKTKQQNRDLLFPSCVAWGWILNSPPPSPMLHPASPLPPLSRKNNLLLLWRLNEIAHESSQSLLLWHQLRRGNGSIIVRSQNGCFSKCSFNT